MKINFMKIAWSGIIIYILVMITLQRYPNMPDNQVSIGDFSNIVIGLVAIVTLGFSILDRHRETIKHNSSIALDSYISSIDALIIKLSDPEVNTDIKFFLIDNCHKNLLLCQSSITEQEHKLFAQAKYETFRTHLQLAYHHLQVEDFLAVPKELRDEYNMSAWSTNWLACSYLLVSCWLKYVAPKCPFYQDSGFATYGNYLCTEERYICSMLSMLIAKPLSIKPTSALLDRFIQFNKTCEFELHHCDLESVFENYPSLAAHLMLGHTCSAYRSKNNNYPNLSIIVHDNDNKKVWFTFKGTNVQHVFDIPNKLANSKYLKKI